jgi:CheY-like chemotaxis protein
VPPKVLVVDDEPSILTSTTELLREMGYDAVSLASHERVVEVATAERPDVLLQDVRMPGLDLERLIREIRAVPALNDLPIVLFSASFETLEVGERLGVKTVLEKPFKPRDLARILEAAREGDASFAV